MGSFFTLCSVTQKTIFDGQEMYVQLMLPSGYLKHEPSIGEVFKDSFLNAVKEKGLDEAIKTFEEATATWSSGKKLAPKGMMVSNDGAYANWVPFGPAIRGIYDDCGHIAPLEDEDSKKRVEILENLIGLPFKTIMSVATDNRWYSYGLGKYGEDEDSRWRPEGISKDMPEWQLMLCEKLSVTYIHAAVYDELVNPNFSADELDGVMRCEYSIKWLNEYLDPIKEKLPKHLENIKSPDLDDEDPVKRLERRWTLREITDDIGVFRCLNRELSLIYQACLARENESLEWFYESLRFMYSLSGMCLTLERSQYGSQHQNWFGWKRIYAALEPKIEQTLTDYGYYENEDLL